MATTYTKNLSTSDGKAFVRALKVYLDLGDKLTKIIMNADNTADCTFEQTEATP